MPDIKIVFRGAKVRKQLQQVPPRIESKLIGWARMVQLNGIRAIRMRTGFHDEPLSGPRQGQRSIRLNQAYRAIYVELANGSIEMIEVIEVNKHEY